ncbi:protein of unknown function [Azospirillum baldaniorum]|uniref:Uncharacterized protein n=1 Tax=Azospirillum baldaniorum TaxID=1064539 RepID=A0A9P1NLA4_9PROT|nr:protein of unknown function [Azospirillum baldaniorum]
MYAKQCQSGGEGSCDLLSHFLGETVAFVAAHAMRGVRRSEDGAGCDCSDSNMTPNSSQFRN